MTWLLGAVAFVAYAWGAAAGVDWLDAGELTAAAWTLGVSHPPGQPVYTLIGKLAAFVPAGEIAFRLNVLSAAAAALAVAGTARLALVLVGRDDRTGRVGATLAAILVGLSPLTVEQATRGEVYAPLAAAVAWGAVGVVRARRSAARDGVLIAALLFGLAAGLHPLLAAAAALPLALAALRAAPRRAPWAILLGALGLLAALSMAVRAAAATPPLLLWEPSVTRAYGGNFALAGIGERLFDHLLLLGEGSGLAALVGGAAGLAFGAITGLRGAAALAASGALVVLATAAQRVFLPANPDVHGYLSVALPLLAPGVAVAVVAVGKVVAHPAGVVVALLPVGFLAAAGPRRAVFPPWRASDDTLRFHDHNVGAMPPGPALFLASSDHGTFTAWYEQLVAGDRPDVAVAVDSLVTSSWHLRMIDRARPELFVPFIDDGGRRDALLERLVAANRVVRERPVAGDFAGDVGRRVARLAWRVPEMPIITPRFISEPWELALAERMRRIAAGAPPGKPPPADAVPELRLAWAWHALLAGDGAAAEPVLAALGPGARVAAGRFLVGRGREAQAVAALERALPDEGAALLAAAIHGNAGRLAEAEAILDAALARAPRSPRLLAQRGKVRARAGRLDDAAADWRASLALDPAQPDVRALLGHTP